MALPAVQVAPSMHVRLLEDTLMHMASGASPCCGRVVGLDGNAKLARSRCRWAGLQGRPGRPSLASAGTQPLVLTMPVPVPVTVQQPPAGPPTARPRPAAAPCSALRPRNLLPPAGGGADEAEMFLQKFCTNTPQRGDALGRCKDCAALGNVSLHQGWWTAACGPSLHPPGGGGGGIRVHAGCVASMQPQGKICCSPAPARRR